jgi:hypothetical protein
MITVTASPTGRTYTLGEDSAEAARQATAAALAATAAAAASRYFPSQAAGEAGSTTGQFFSHKDGSGNLIYRERTGGGSTIIAQALTQAMLTAEGARLDGRIDDQGMKLVGRTSVMEFGAVGDGTTNDTGAFQDGVDSLTDGGELFVPDGTYSVGAVNVTNQNVHIRLAPGAVLKARAFTGSDRGIFQLEGMIDAGFKLSGGRVDLNGEGPFGIGVAGRLPNTYAAGTIAAIKGINGPVNAAIFARRSTGIEVEGMTVENSGEDGFLFRNCGQVMVHHCKFRNIANWAVECSWTVPGGDGGSTTMPENRGDWLFEDCEFEYINDLMLGSNNGGCIGGGVGSDVPLGNFKNFVVKNCRVFRCWRGFQLEAPYGGTTWDNVVMENIYFDEVSQNIVTIVGTRSYKVDKIIGDRLGDAGACAVHYTARAGTNASHYPDVAVIIISGDCKTGDITNCDTEDSRAGGAVKRTDGAITAGSDLLNSAGASFSTNDVGKSVAILGAGPSGAGYTTVHQSWIKQRISATQVRLEHAAQTTVTGATFGYGGTTRHGVILRADRPRDTLNNVSGTGGQAFSISGSSFVAGANSGLTNEPDGVGLLAMAVQKALRVSDATFEAPTNGTAGPVGIVTANNVDTFSGEIALDATVKVSGFASKYSGKFAKRPTGIATTKSFPLDRSLAPSATANTYGAVELVYADGPTFIDLLRASFQTAGGAFAGGETITWKLQLAEHDGDSAFPAVEIAVTAAGTTILNAGHLLTANPDAKGFKAMMASMKSSATGSVVTGKVNATARQV